MVDSQRYQRRKSTVPLGGLHIVDLWLERIGTGLRRIPIHDVRHTYASLLLEQGSR